VLAGAEKLCAEAQVALKSDDGLFDEVAGLVEWPVRCWARSMESSWTCRPRCYRLHEDAPALFCDDDEGRRLANRFVVVANTVARDGGAAIVDGNERVLRARLSDANFSGPGPQVRLEERLPTLKAIVFHAKLGTQADRVGRIEILADQDRRLREGRGLRAGHPGRHLCKADLVSAWSASSPIAGIMGRYYALGEKLPPGGDASATIRAGRAQRPLPSAPISIAWRWPTSSTRSQLLVDRRKADRLARSLACVVQHSGSFASWSRNGLRLPLADSSSPRT